MTSKSLFIDLMKENMKRRLWPAALSILGNLFALPVFTLLMTNVWFDRLAQNRTVIQDIQSEFYTMILSVGNIPLFLIIGGLALINGLQGMAYLHSKPQSDLYGSIPVKRTTYFSAVCLNGLLIFMIPYIVSFLLTALIGFSRGLVTGQHFLYGLLNCLIEIILYAAVYLTVVLAAILTGHIVVAIAGSLVLLGVGPLIYLMDIAYRSTFFMTFYESEHTEHWNLLFSSPVAALSGAMIEMQTLTDASKLFSSCLGKIAVFSLIEVILLFALCYVLIRKRPAEAAGKAMAFAVTKPVIKILIMVPVSMASAIIFYSIGESSLGWFIFGLAIGVLLSQAVIEIIYDFDFKACIRHPKSFIAGTLVTVFCVCIFIFDPFGYDRYIPDLKNVAYAAVHSYELHSGLTYTDENGNYWSDDDYHLEHMKLTDLEDVEVLAQNGVRYATLARKYNFTDRNNRFSTEDRDRAYQLLLERGYVDEGDAVQMTNFIICWITSSGRRIYRSYSGINLGNSDVFTAFDNIYRTVEYKQAVFPSINAEAKELEILSVNTGTGFSYIKPSDAEKQELLTIYREELLSQDATALRDEFPVARINSETFDHLHTDPLYEYDYNRDRTWQNYDFYVYPSFTKTIGWLKKQDIDVYDYMNPDIISKMDISTYVDDQYYTVSYTKETDADMIGEILPDLVPSDFYRLNYAFLPEDPYEMYGNMSVAVTFENNADSSPMDFEFRSDRLPKLIMDDMKPE